MKKKMRAWKERIKRKASSRKNIRYAVSVTKCFRSTVVCVDTCGFIKDWSHSSAPFAPNTSDKGTNWRHTCAYTQERSPLPALSVIRVLFRNVNWCHTAECTMERRSHTAVGNVAYSLLPPLTIRSTAGYTVGRNHMYVKIVGKLLPSPVPWSITKDDTRARNPTSVIPAACLSPCPPLSSPTHENTQVRLHTRARIVTNASHQYQRGTNMHDLMVQRMWCSVICVGTAS